MQRVDPLEKTLMLGKAGDGEQGATEDEMIRWHQRLYGHESEQTQRENEGQGSLLCYSPWSHRESTRTSQLNNHNLRGRPGTWSVT